MTKIFRQLPPYLTLDQFKRFVTELADQLTGDKSPVAMTDKQWQHLYNRYQKSVNRRKLQ